jgi:hypothetical protein
MSSLRHRPIVMDALEALIIELKRSGAGEDQHLVEELVAVADMDDGDDADNGLYVRSKTLDTQPPMSGGMCHAPLPLSWRSVSGALFAALCMAAKGLSSGDLHPGEEPPERAPRQRAATGESNPFTLSTHARAVHDQAGGVYS